MIRESAVEKTTNDFAEDGDDACISRHKDKIFQRFILQARRRVMKTRPSVFALNEATAMPNHPCQLIEAETVICPDV